MSTETKDDDIPEVSDLDCAFPTRWRELLPPWEDLTEDERAARYRDTFCKALNRDGREDVSFYAVDARFADDLPFLTWIVSLESVMKDWEAKHGNLPYSLPLKDCTGLLCWRDMFDDGMTPEEAFTCDQSYWEE